MIKEKEKEIRKKSSYYKERLRYTKEYSNTWLDMCIDEAEYKNISHLVSMYLPFILKPENQVLLIVLAINFIYTRDTRDIDDAFWSEFNTTLTNEEKNDIRDILAREANSFPSKKWISFYKEQIGITAYNITCFWKIIEKYIRQNSEELAFADYELYEDEMEKAVPPNQVLLKRFLISKKGHNFVTLLAYGYNKYKKGILSREELLSGGGYPPNFWTKIFELTSTEQPSTSPISLTWPIFIYKNKNFTIRYNNTAFKPLNTIIDGMGIFKYEEYHFLNINNQRERTVKIWCPDKQPIGIFERTNFGETIYMSGKDIDLNKEYCFIIEKELFNNLDLSGKETEDVWMNNEQQYFVYDFNTSDNTEKLLTYLQDGGYRLTRKKDLCASKLVMSWENNNYISRNAGVYNFKNTLPNILVHMLKKEGDVSRFLEFNRIYLQIHRNGYSPANINLSSLGFVNPTERRIENINEIIKVNNLEHGGSISGYITIDKNSNTKKVEFYPRELHFKIVKYPFTNKELIEEWTSDIKMNCGINNYSWKSKLAKENKKYGEILSEAWSAYYHGIRGWNNIVDIKLNKLKDDWICSPEQKYLKILLNYVKEGRKETLDLHIKKSPELHVFIDDKNLLAKLPLLPSDKELLR